MPFGYQPTSQQDAFDFMVRESRKMPREAQSQGTCVLRSPDGEEACFFGLFLTDAEAVDENGKPWELTVRQMQEKGLMPARLRDYVDVLTRGQEIHDDLSHWWDDGHGPAHPEKMGTAFREMATYYGLDASAVREAYPEIYQLEAA